jgi:hypothetical protein
MPNPILHFEINGKDQKLLEDFYKSIFDWQITPAMKGYSLVDTGSVPGGGIGAMGQVQHVTFYVGVEDVAGALALVESKGGKTAFGPHTIPDGGTIGAFLDPEGHLIGLLKAAAGK